MYILGVSESHNASLCLLKDGKVVHLLSEERFSRNKNQYGFPVLAYKYAMEREGITADDLDLVILSMRNPIVYLHQREQGDDKIMASFVKKWSSPLKQVSDLAMYKFSFFEKIYTFLYKNLYKPIFWPRLEKAHLLYLKNDLGISLEKVTYVDHHLCHAYSVYARNLRNQNKKYLVMTLDAIGDGTCGSINIAQRGELEKVHEIPNGKSLPRLYAWITHYMGMRMSEHEYKVMGLAPYADKRGSEEVYKILKTLVWTNGIDFETKCNSELFYYHLIKLLDRKRFDWIGGGSQMLLEDLLASWIKAAIERYKISDILLSGGVFMNIKANKVLSELSEVNSVDVMPSAGDESTVIGAVYYGYKNLAGLKKAKKFRLDDLYLGTSYTNEEVLDTLKEDGIWDNSDYTVTKEDDIELKIAELINEGKIVARLRGRMEFGARALGNRSIIANPKDYSVVRVLNEQIKGRDFWMPFASTILEERQHDYLVNTKNIKSPYMMFGFDTTELGKEELKAGNHPYDYTSRPQILSKRQNPLYYKIIKNFEKLTGIGAVLNTSFNIHGEPIVCSPHDAIHTLVDSGLEHLALEDYLIVKNTV